jgi:acyl carrier protein
MTMADNLKENLKLLMSSLFKCDTSELSDEVGPGDIQGWDSLGHVALMAEIQKQFGTHVPVEDAIEVESISDLVEILERLQQKV